LSFNLSWVSGLVKKNITILAFNGFYLPGYKGGGPIKTIKNLFEEAGNQVSFRLITSDRDLGDNAPYKTIACGEWNSSRNVSAFYAQSGFKGYVQIAKIILAKNYDLVYLNSFFSPKFSFFPLVISKLLGQPVVLGPRGEFSSGALSLKSTKKRIVIAICKLIGLHRWVVFQASSRFEAEDIRRVLGPKVDVKIAEDISAQEFITDFPTSFDEELKAVFISRITPMKNLLVALEVLCNVRQPLCYHIYGPIEDQDYWLQCEKVKASLPSYVRVEYMGELTPDQVVCTMAKYDIFFMPTKGENYGHVITEALCAGLPILISDKTPWRNLEKQGVGWDLPLDSLSAFSLVLDQLAMMPSDQHQKMRKTVVAWAKNKFSQSDAVDANIEMFRYAYEKQQG
jgi:glycosyltransferase involved in cell wall biosynthesis